MNERQISRRKLAAAYINLTSAQKAGVQCRLRKDGLMQHVSYLQNASGQCPLPYEVLPEGLPLATLP